MMEDFKKFLLWKDDPKCPFNVSFNGTDKSRPRISYEKGKKNYTIDEVYEYWSKEIKK